MHAEWSATLPSRMHGTPCLCTSPIVHRINRRIGAGLSRRSVMRGAAGAMLAASLGAARGTTAADTPRSILFTNAPIFDGRSSSLRRDTSVLVSGNTIEALLPVGQDVADARVIDCGGRVLMPGLIDAHWHAMLAGISQITALTAEVPYIHLVAAQEAERTLMRGFTSVRDMGGPTFPLKRAIDQGIATGPRIFPSGAMISQTGGHGDFRPRSEVPRDALSTLTAAEVAGVAMIADGRAEVLRRVREQLLLGASQIKIMVGGGVSSLYDPIEATQYTVDEIRAAVEAASDWGTYVAAHVYVPKGIIRAIDNGVMSIEHGQLADEEAARRIVDAGAWWSLQPFLSDEDSNPKPTAEQREQQELIAEGTVRAYTLGKELNAKLAWGTDILFSPDRTWTQNRQLTKLTRWFDPAEVLQMATGRNAELCGLSGIRNPYPGALGVIEAGALADMLLIDGNPLEDIDLIADPEKNMKIIMKDGVIYKDDISG